MGSRPVGLLVAWGSIVSAAQLRPATLEAWNDYVKAAEVRLRSDEASQIPWMDQIPGVRERLRRGEIVAWPATATHSRAVPHGMIHDWSGAIFIPRTSVREVLSVIEDYDRYADYYGPTIRWAKLLSRNGDESAFRVRYSRKALFVTVVLDIDYDMRYCQVDEKRWYSVARSTSIQEINNSGEAGERAVVADNGSGYIWRTFGISKFDESDGGVYLEQESIALSRTIPVELRWLVKPFVEHLSKELVVETLRQTRDAVTSAGMGGRGGHGGQPELASSKLHFWDTR